MSGPKAEVLGYYLPNQAYVELKPGQQPYFYYEGKYELVTPTNYQWNTQYTGIYSAIYEGNNPVWLETGVQFYVGIPAPPPPPSAVAGYYVENGYQSLAPGETAIYYYEGIKYPVKTQEDVEWAKYCKSYPAIEYQTGNIRWLSIGTLFCLNPSAVPRPSWSPFQSSFETRPIPSQSQKGDPANIAGVSADTMVVSPQPTDQMAGQGLSPVSNLFAPADLSKTEFNFPPPPPPAVPNNPPMQQFTKPPSPKALPQLSRQSMIPDSSAPSIKQFPCSICHNLVTKHIKLRAHKYCLKCALGKLKRNELTSTSSGGEASWSADEIYGLYSQLKKTLDEASKADLPAEVPLPIDTFVCVGKDKPEKPDYPPRGHFAGKAAVVAEGGCPNGHVLCKGCANGLNSCPVCGAFVPYQELPSGCPAFPGKCENHCASFEKACQVPGCTGGMWPKKQRKHEEAKIEEAKEVPPQAPKKEA